MKLLFILSNIYSVKFMDLDKDNDSSDIDIIYELFITISIIMQNISL